MTEINDAEQQLAEKEARIKEVKLKIETCEQRTKDAVAESVVALDDLLAEARRRLDKARVSGAAQWKDFSAWFDEHWEDVRQRAKDLSAKL